jgi:hypothetical protein
MNTRIRLTLGIAVVCLLPGLGITAPKNKIKPVVPPPVVNPYAEYIQHLQEAQLMLVNANHDYDGHRAHAVRHVTHALRALKGTPVSNRPGGAIFEGQAASDAQLQKASDHLTHIGNKLGKSPGDPNQMSAMNSVQNALQEINIALKVR